MLHLGDQNVYGGVRRFTGEKLYRTMVRDATEVFRRGDIPELIRAVDRNFGAGTFSLRYLFRDEQRKIVRTFWRTPPRKRPLCTATSTGSTGP